ncbi:ribonuclease III [Vagococcus xieshaowenii]|uniref:Ribonuclease 3 n=1 Tax=Vagococcus xieshaowenii TaxID=2562451 RepID=A0AAJ5EGB7_9ENTE|nr:ribonuclease III [Vagococcus xieshaowenii]QCA28271.1 ribonuclease III [Vagococcus xieshaowenii]TFZ41926.1 ribonuclease III [Vagococcus xieshaowenii]
MNEKLISTLREKYHITFTESMLLEQAFTHSSYVNEHRNLKQSDYERLEFLGDATLELLISEFLFNWYPDFPEGKLTKIRATIVREESLAKFAQECGFDQYIRLGKGEENSNGRQRPALLCDLFEAFLGALLLDQGLEAVKNFLAIVVFPKIEAGVFLHEMDHKTNLQEILQKNGDVLISYELVKEEGPAHEREFYVAVKLNDEVIGQGKGKSKKSAEQEAAHQAILNLSAQESTQK